MFSASSPGSPAVGGWGLVDALLLPPGKTVARLWFLSVPGHTWLLGFLAVSI